MIPFNEATATFGLLEFALYGPVPPATLKVEVVAVCKTTFDGAVLYSATEVEVGDAGTVTEKDVVAPTASRKEIFAEPELSAVTVNAPFCIFRPVTDWLLDTAV